MEHLPWYIATIFSIAVLTGVGLFIKAAHYARAAVTILLSLILVQSCLAIFGFYSDPLSLSTRFPLLVAPSLLIGLLLFLTHKGRTFIDSLDIKTLTILHVVRILVEMVLLWLCTHRAIPLAMTFEGRNFDILSGISAPLVYYFYFVKRKLGRTAMVAWNAACVLLLLNVVASAFLSLPARYQHFNFEQPNIAVGYFPFALLPAVLVPLVLFAHAASIRQLILNKPLASHGAA